LQHILHNPDFGLLRIVGIGGEIEYFGILPSAAVSNNSFTMVSAPP